MSDEVYIREPGVDGCEHLEVCEHACRMGCRSFKPRVDRDALLALADEMEEFGNLPVKHPGIRVLHNDDFSIELGYARRIREACGVTDDGR